VSNSHFLETKKKNILFTDYIASSIDVYESGALLSCIPIKDLMAIVWVEEKKEIYFPRSVDELHVD
jgi:hypothetical protein